MTAADLPSPPPPPPELDDGDLSDLLQELRILLQGAQLLSAFLILLPFSAGFASFGLGQRFIYLATLCSSLASLAIFSAPAVQHRLQRPLRDRASFKEASTRMIVTGAVPLSIALVLAPQVVVAHVFNAIVGAAVAGTFALLIGALWWVIPLIRRRRDRLRSLLP